MKENKNITPLSLNKNVPFKVPQNYFENFASNFEKKIKMQHTVKLRKIRSMIAAAAVFLGLMATGGIYYSNIQKNKINYANNYEAYIMSQVDEPSMMDYYVNFRNSSVK